MDIYSKDTNKCYDTNLSICPEWKVDGWRLIHSKNGEYCQLDRRNGWEVWMGNGPDEVDDMIYGAVRMRGNCLVLGLGIGLVVQYIDVVGKCKKITVVEKSQTVIDQIGPWLKENTKIPIEFICADDEEFLQNTDRKWDSMYADTWQRCVDELKKINRLREYAEGKIKGKKVFWCENEFKELERQGRWR